MQSALMFKRPRSSAETTFQHQQDRGSEVAWDGEVVHVPMTLVDERRSIKDAGRVRIHDEGEPPAVMDIFGRPAGTSRGYVFAPGVTDEPAVRAYDAYNRRLCNAWREGEPAAAATADPVVPSFLGDAGEARDRAYAAYDRRLTSAWRGSGDAD